MEGAFPVGLAPVLAMGVPPVSTEPGAEAGFQDALSRNAALLVPPPPIMATGLAAPSLGPVAPVLATPVPATPVLANPVPATPVPAAQAFGIDASMPLPAAAPLAANPLAASLPATSFPPGPVPLLPVPPATAPLTSMGPGDIMPEPPATGPVAAASLPVSPAIGPAIPAQAPAAMVPAGTTPPDAAPPGPAPAEDLVEVMAPSVPPTMAPSMEAGIEMEPTPADQTEDEPAAEVEGTASLPSGPQLPPLAMTPPPASPVTPSPPSTLAAAAMAAAPQPVAAMVPAAAAPEPETAAEDATPEDASLSVAPNAVPAPLRPAAAAPRPRAEPEARDISAAAPDPAEAKAAEAEAAEGLPRATVPTPPLGSVAKTADATLPPAPATTTPGAPAHIVPDAASLAMDVAPTVTRTAEAPPPAPPPPPMRQVAPMAVALAFAPSGTGGFQLSLEPGELGRVEIRVQREGETHAVRIVAERPETLALLLRDRQELDRNLADAGLRVEAKGIEFSLGTASGEREQRPREEQRGGGLPRGLSPSGGAATLESTPARAARGLLDLNI